MINTSNLFRRSLSVKPRGFARPYTTNKGSPDLEQEIKRTEDFILEGHKKLLLRRKGFLVLGIPPEYDTPEIKHLAESAIKLSLRHNVRAKIVGPLARWYHIWNMGGRANLLDGCDNAIENIWTVCSDHHRSKNLDPASVINSDTCHPDVESFLMEGIKMTSKEPDKWAQWKEIRDMTHRITDVGLTATPNLSLEQALREIDRGQHGYIFRLQTVLTVEDVKGELHRDVLATSWTSDVKENQELKWKLLTISPYPTQLIQ
ncbi:hypothetical protein PROFUN_01241 [Planoprotostelium fungivorum]|uniref:Uncharacterized protein n=1 Tax=Planoprotostelium fungivorum TaxID=1890364 RepID=A0A2P6NZM7_9EUKA|nr:hypothetical protein PROFUN_01241 [Planoprotostelium fungivorum]